MVIKRYEKEPSSRFFLHSNPGHAYEIPGILHAHQPGNNLSYDMSTVSQGFGIKPLEDTTDQGFSISPRQNHKY